MSFENYLLSHRTQNQYTIERNSRQHPTILEIYQKRVEMLDWTLDRYRTLQQQEQQAHQNNQNQNDLLIIINRINEELYEKKKIARNNLTQSEPRNETAMYRLEETTIEDRLSEIVKFINQK